MAADAEATLPALIEACKRLITADRRRAFEERGEQAGRRAARRALERARAEAAYAWDASPISTARLSAELWAQIKNEDWSLVSESGNSQRLADAAVELRQALPVHRRLGRRRRRLRRAGGGRRRAREQEARPALGRRFRATATSCTRRASVDGGASPDSAALRHAQQPRLSPGSHAHPAHGATATTAASRRAHIGTTIDNPNIDFAKVAQGMGVHAQGPITNPADLGPAIRRALDVVKRGEPSLVDVVTQPR